MNLARKIVVAGLVSLSAACGGGVSDTARVNVTVTGLAPGAEVKLLGANQPLTLHDNGSYTAIVRSNASYGFSVGTQPAGAYCTVSNGVGIAGRWTGSGTVAVSCAVPVPYNPATVVTTYAGSGASGYLDGASSVARFGSIDGLAVDSKGNVYVADAANNVIRKIDLAGTVSTVAGSGVRGKQDGLGTAAMFNLGGSAAGTVGLAVDASDNLYVADTSNNMIRKITPSGEVTTVAGSGFPGSGDGTGTQATFYHPTDIKFDPAGNLYIVTEFGQLRKMSPAGLVTTVEQSGVWSVAVDSKGNVYTSDYNVINKLTPEGQSELLAGALSGDAGNVNDVGPSARFYGLNFIAADSNGNIYGSEAGGTATSPATSMDVRVTTPIGVVSTYAGSGVIGNQDGNGSVATFSRPGAIAFDSTGALYVADRGNYVVRKISWVIIM